MDIPRSCLAHNPLQMYACFRCVTLMRNGFSIKCPGRETGCFCVFFFRLLPSGALTTHCEAQKRLSQTSPSAHPVLGQLGGCDGDLTEEIYTKEAANTIAGISKEISWKQRSKRTHKPSLFFLKLIVPINVIWAWLTLINIKQSKQERRWSCTSHVWCHMQCKSRVQ